LAHAQPELRKDILPLLKQAVGKLKRFHPGAAPRGMEEPERSEFLDNLVESAVGEAIKDGERCLASIEDVGLFLDPEDNRFGPKAKTLLNATRDLEVALKLLASMRMLLKR
jgi:hypothetical protein